MRKILLATTALVGFAAAGAAQAATSPLNVTVGGSVDFVAGAFNESRHSGAAQANADFMTIYSLNFGVNGKAANGLAYGGTIVLDNEPDQVFNYLGNSNQIAVSEATVFMSGAFGKIQLGDARGATDLTVVAPTVGAGQATGRYIDFLGGLGGQGNFAKNLVVGVEGKDHSTNVTYYTPKVGNDTHKVQMGVTYVPNFADYGSNVVQTNESDYKNMFKTAAVYTGTFNPVTVGFSAHLISASSDRVNLVRRVRDFTSWGVGAKAAANGFTLGGTYTDLGHVGTTVNARNRNQDQYSVGLTYEFNKASVGFTYLGGKGYDGSFGVGADYVKTFNSYGLGGAYTWAPGLTTNIDGVLFDQKRDDVLKPRNSGYVLLLSQKLAF